MHAMATRMRFKFIASIFVTVVFSVWCQSSVCCVNLWFQEDKETLPVLRKQPRKQTPVCTREKKYEYYIKKVNGTLLHPGRQT